MVGRRTPDDVWIVGSSTSGTVIDHWDGAEWTQVPSPNSPGRDGVLHQVTVLAPNDAWAVGEAYNQAPIETLMEHWDGSQWSIVSSPNPGLYRNQVLEVDGDAPDDVWAVGVGSNGSHDYHVRLLYLHWDGTEWNWVH